MRTFEDACLGCEVCRDCGRDVPRERIICDKCNDYIDDESDCFEYEGEELCFDCYMEMITPQLDVEMLDESELNEFLEFVFDEQERKDILKAEFVSQKADYKADLIKEWVLQNMTPNEIKTKINS